MSADVLTDRLPDSRPLHHLISQTRRLLRSSWVATGAGLTLGLLLGALVVLTAFDLVAPLKPYTWTVFQRVIPIHGVLRLLALLLVVVPATWAFFVGVVRPLFRRLAAVHVARRIEEHLPGIHNRLVSCIDLEARNRPPVSAVFHRRLLNEALDRIRSFRPRMVLDALSLRRAVLFAFITTLAFGLIWATAAHRLPRTLARLFQPFADLPPVSDVAYEVQPGKADVLREEPIVFAAHVRSEADPQDLRLELYNDVGKPTHVFDLKPDRQDGKWWHFTVDSASLGAGYQNGFRYRVFGGDTWSQEYRIRLVDRPVLLSVNTAVYYPAYMRIPEPHPTPPQAAEVTGPDGGEVEVVVEAQGDVASGDVQLLKPGFKAIPLHAQTERSWFEEKLPFGASTEGNWHWEHFRNRPVHTEPVTLGTHGHWFQGDPVGHSVTPGDMLFAYVWIDPQNPPETLFLQWYDGETWDHGAYWGKDNIKEGKADSPACIKISGTLPKAGEWVRLEVPAVAVGLQGKAPVTPDNLNKGVLVPAEKDLGPEGKTLRGMAFKLHGGRCFWGRAGTVQTVERGVEEVKSFPMKQAEDGRWVGRFPLKETGLFRAELRNEQGHANKPMKEMKYVALPDKPPQVVIERQGSEMVLSRPAAVPLTVSAFDDYGLDEITVLVRTGDVGEYKPRTLKVFKTPERSATVVDALAEAAALKPGGVLWYMAEAKDTKGQTTRTREYVIRIAADANAADTQLEAFEKSQDPFRDRLLQLIAEQKKIQEQMEKLNKEYAPVAEKMQAALDEARAKQEPDPKKPPMPEQPKVDPETARKFTELQKELAKLTQQEQQNANAAQQIANELAKAVEQANKLDMLPKPIADEMRSMQRQFQQLVADAMRNLGQEMNRAAQPNPQDSPDLKGMEQRGQRLQKDLEDAKSRLDALAQARKGVREDLKKALEQLQRELLALDGKMTDRELQELKDFLAKLREQMKDVQQKQEALAKDTENGLDLNEARKRQEDLDKQLEELIAKAKKLLDTKKNRKDRKPEFPDSPYDPDRDEMRVPPREEDTNEPLPSKKDPNARRGDKKEGDKKDDKKEMDEDDKEPLHMPALGGKREKVDPRFAKKRRPVKRDPMKGDKEDPDEERGNLEDRQNDNERNLDAAEKSLASDQRTLEEMVRQLEESLKKQGKAKPSNQSEQSEAEQMADQLWQLMQSPAMRQAMNMANRMRQARQQGRAQARGMRQPNPSNMSMPHDQAHDAPASKDVDLSKLDPESRALILKLPPSRLRDELIQGMSEQGPEAYRAFIQDYFKRLTDTKAPPK
jgi:hypothetical protein